MSLTQGSSYALLQAWPDGKSWLTQAECRLAEDADDFFGRDRAKARAALQLCRRCPVRDACLEFALANDHRYGIWGGLTEDKRRRLHREREAARDTSLAPPPRGSVGRRGRS